MNSPPPPEWIAFAGRARIARGSPREVALVVKAHVEGRADAPVLIFDARTSQLTDLDLRGSSAAVLRRLPAQTLAQPLASAETDDNLPRGPGRPRLGVVAREVTLLPRHWEWLATQPGGASVALRKLVEQAKRANTELDRSREARDATYRFMHAMAGNEPGFEEASRALFADDTAGLQACLAKWPRDIRSHALALAASALPGLVATKAELGR